MSRVVKPPEARRNELLDCAQALFFAQGYDRTTVNDIIDRAGVSKGGFYHHFSSKEEMLEALALRLAHESLALLEDVVEMPGPGALARLNGFFERARRMKIEDAPRLRATFDVLYKPENAVLHNRIYAAVIPVIRPLLARIIAQGKAEGVFDVPDAEATAEIILMLNACTHNVMAKAIANARTLAADAAIEALEERLRFQGIVIDRILGLPDGSLVYIEPGVVRAILEAR